MLSTSSHCLFFAVDTELRCSLSLPALQGKCHCLTLCMQILTGSLDNPLDQSKADNQSRAYSRVTTGSRLGCYQVFHIVTVRNNRCDKEAVNPLGLCCYFSFWRNPETPLYRLFFSIDQKQAMLFLY